MQYYILRHESPEGSFIDGDVTFSPALPDYYQVGKDIIRPGTRIGLVLDKRVKKLKADFFLTTCGAFFVSAAMKTVLEHLENDLLFLEADARYSSAQATENSYFLIHARHKMACFDYLNSEYAGKPMVLAKLANGTLAADYKARGIKKLRLQVREGTAPDFFFVDHIVWIDPLISETVVNAAISRKLRLNVEKISQEPL
ncbi:hypothetical protein ASF84_13385 [Pseudomonas sp. Leaf127]|uniref:imm11 family protein n=1 Tax=Pseudomonas sp. Leaf127 TaxID=1736267 RepID=UPI000703523C|nr:DUF1629 domain-containing protein [Pseudomonas sp. Leaf127]KQQ56266.1 hypothetical protein ASF84_13385 [Pseudomonas sp. Leaf127]